LLWEQAKTPLETKSPASFYGKNSFENDFQWKSFHMDSLTAAHNIMPFDNLVKSLGYDTKDSPSGVRINDRLPKNSRE